MPALVSLWLWLPCTTNSRGEAPKPEQQPCEQTEANERVCNGGERRPEVSRCVADGPSLGYVPRPLPDRTEESR